MNTIFILNKGILEIVTKKLFSLVIRNFNLTRIFFSHLVSTKSVVTIDFIIAMKYLEPPCHGIYHCNIFVNKSRFPFLYPPQEPI